MSTARPAAFTPYRLARVRLELSQITRRLMLVKIVCGIALGICYWYSVPYVLPFIVHGATAESAAAESAAFQGSASRQLAMPVIAFFCLLLLRELPRRGRFEGHLRYFAAAYVIWAVMSVAWSDDPSLTIKRLVVFLINILAIYTFARRFSLIEISVLAFFVTGTVAILALYGDVVMQHIFDPRNADYRFQGIAEANYQAMSLVVGIFSGLTLFDRRPAWRKFLAPALFVAFILLYLTRSRVSTIICLMMAGIMMFRLARKILSAPARAMLAVACMAVVLPVLVYVVGQKGLGAAQSAFMMGRTDTQNTSNLSNRAPLWAELSEYVKTRPLQGFGYAGFWSPSRVSLISGHQGWTVPHAHETYLDQTLSLGFVGSLLYAGVLWGAIFFAWKRYRRSRQATDLLAAAMLTWLAMEGLAESAPIDPYLPTTLAYACIVKMCFAEGSETEQDTWLGSDQLLGGVTPALLEKLPPNLRAEAKTAMESTHV